MDFGSPNGLAMWEEEPMIREGARIITRLQAQKKNPDRVSIYLDGEFAFGLPGDVVVRHMLRKGMHVDEEMQAQLLAEDQLVRAKLCALEYLSYKPRTEHEVAEKLRDKAFDETIIAQAVARFVELRYLDDESYARMYASSRLRSKGRGPRRIQKELQNKGVIDEHISLALEHLVETEDLVQESIPRAQKRWDKLHREPSPWKRKQKTLEYLLRQGFDFSTAHQIFDAVDQSAAAGDDDDEESPEELSPPEPQAEDFWPLAEKRWGRLAGESSSYKRRQKFTDFMRRRSVPFGIIKELIARLEEADEELEEELLEEAHEPEEEVDPLEELRPVASKRWERLCRSETDRWKRRKKLSEYLRRQGFAYEHISAVLEELD